MEIRLKAIGDTPHYLAELCFSREGDTIVIQVADEKNREKARYECSPVQFNQIADIVLADAPIGDPAPIRELTQPPINWPPIVKDF